MEFVRWFDQIRLSDVDLVGGKGANLGELTFAKLPVPPGYVVTSDAYRYAIASAGIADKLEAMVAGVDETRAGDLNVVAEEAQELIRTIVLPDDLSVLDPRGLPPPGRPVHRRRTLIGHQRGRRGHSFAGMNSTFTNVMGDADLLVNVVDCWASLYGARVISYRATARSRDPRNGRHRPRDGPLGAFRRDVHRRPFRR